MRINRLRTHAAMIGLLVAWSGATALIAYAMWERSTPAQTALTLATDRHPRCPCFQATVPGAQVNVDLDGVEAKRFDAQTSGLVVAYAPDGRRLFHGGVTAARGHEGDNAGRAALVGALTADREGRAAVYGCAL